MLPTTRYPARGYRPTAFGVNREFVQKIRATGWWPLQSGNNFVDLVAAISGVPNGARTVVPCVQGGYCREQTDSTQRVDILEAATRGAISKTEGFISFWLQPTSTSGTQSYLEYRSGIDIDNIGGLRFSALGKSITIAALAVGEIAHLMLSWSIANNTILAWKNGVRVGSATGLTTPGATTSVYLGNNVFSEWFRGRMWDVVIGDRPTSDDIAWALYNPATRQNLYFVPGRRVFFDVGAAPAGRTTKNTRRFYLGTYAGVKQPPYYPGTVA